jgi:hypothetical protein
MNAKQILKWMIVVLLLAALPILTAALAIAQPEQPEESTWQSGETSVSGLTGEEQKQLLGVPPEVDNGRLNRRNTWPLRPRTSPIPTRQALTGAT